MLYFSALKVHGVLHAGLRFAPFRESAISFDKADSGGYPSQEKDVSSAPETVARLIT